MKFLSKLLDAIGLANSHIRKAEHYAIPSVELNDAIERVVDGIEPKMRYFPGYKKILKNSVSTSLTYINNLVDTIPGPLIINKNTFSTDPHVKCYFSTVDNIQSIFSNSLELREHFDTVENANQNEAYALLCMEEIEKTIVGMELNNDIIQREVIQTTLVFSDHKILSPATNEDDVRSGIKQCIFDGLITHALQKIIELKQKINDQDIKRSKLNSRLKTRQSQGGGLSNLLASARDTEKKAPESEKKPQHIPTSWDAPRYFLELIKNTLSQPESFVSIKEKSFNVTKMGIVCSDNASQTTNTIQLKEILIADVLKRVVAIVHYPRSEMLPKQSFKHK